MHPCGQAPEFFKLRRPDPEAAVHWLWTFTMLGGDMLANQHARAFLGSLWCPELPPAPEAGIHTYVRLTCRELAQAWQRRMLNDEPLARNHSFFGQESD